MSTSPTAFLISKVSKADSPPPGPGLEMTIGPEPIAAISDGNSWTPTWVGFVYKRTRGVLRNVAVLVVMNLEPRTTTTKALPSAMWFLGARPVAIGAGFVMVKGSAFDAPPPGAGLSTETKATVALVTSAAEIVVVREVLEAKNVGRGEPFQKITEPGTKLDPVTASAKAGLPPAMVGGFSEEITGTAFFTVNVSDAVVPPPGAGFETWTVTTAATARSLAVI